MRDTDTNDDAERNADSNAYSDSNADTDVSNAHANTHVTSDGVYSVGRVSERRDVGSKRLE